MRGSALAIVILVACGKSSEAPPPSSPPPSPPATPPEAAAPAEPPPVGTWVAPDLDARTDPCGTRDVELVYVLSNARELYSFDPKKLPGDPFRRIGALDCATASVNSMAVDQSGYAWVGDHAGQLYRASILDASCAPAGAIVSSTAAPAPREFGMGFASSGLRSATNTAEMLYVASDETQGAAGSQLGFVEVTKRPITYTSIATLEARGKWNPELSGTGEGRLFGYFPLRDAGGFIQEIDRDTGKAIGKQWSVPTKSEVGAWAFATWGGTFFVFTSTTEGNQVHAIHPRTGQYKLARDQVPFTIVGAGVSTCAPILEAPP